MQADSYKQGLDQQGAVELGDISFATTGGFNLSAVLSFAFKMLWPELPFIDRVGLVLSLLCTALAVLISMQADSYKQGLLDQQGAVELGDIILTFATTGGFNLSALLVSLILVEVPHKHR